MVSINDGEFDEVLSAWLSGWLEMTPFSGELNGRGHMWKRGKGPVDSDGSCPLSG